MGVVEGDCTEIENWSRQGPADQKYYKLFLNKLPLKLIGCLYVGNQAPAVKHILTILVSFDLITVHNFLSVTV